jgi:hypothetical protein
MLGCERLARQWHASGQGLNLLSSTWPHRPMQGSRLLPGITSSTARARWLRPGHAASDQMRSGLRSRPHCGDCWSIRWLSARHDAIDGIAKSEVGRWLGVRRRFEPPVGSAPVPEGGARPMLQAASRRAPPLNQGPTDTRPLGPPGLLATGHAGREPRPTSDTIASTTSLGTSGRPDDGANDRGCVRQSAPTLSGGTWEP